MAKISPITVARFWSKVSVPASDNVCWEWQGAKSKDGYGNFRIPQFGRFNFGAHRVSYMLYNGDFPPDGLLVRHKCDNPSCVNPLHLESGTKRDNSMDAVERGRFPDRDRRGENNGAAKLKADDVRRIRMLLENGAPMAALANEYGVSFSTISLIQLGKSWQSVV